MYNTNLTAAEIELIFINVYYLSCKKVFLTRSILPL